MLKGLNLNCNQLVQEREVIRENINQISRLSEEFVGIAATQSVSSGLTSYQVNFLNEKRINLRHNLANLKEGLQIHYTLEEEIMRSLVGLRLWRTMLAQHGQILKKLSDIDSVILNLSPMGILYNSTYLKQEIDAVSQIIFNLAHESNSVLTLSEVC